MLEISFIILSIAFLLLAGALAAVLFRIWKVMERLFPLIDQLNQALPGIIQNVQDAVLKVKETSSHVNLQAEKLSQILNQLQSWLSVVTIMRNIKLLPRGTNAAALTRGVSAFVKTFFARRNK